MLKRDTSESILRCYGTLVDTYRMLLKNPNLPVAMMFKLLHHIRYHAGD